MTTVEDIKGFLVTPITLQPSKHYKEEEIKHYIYIKKHQSQNNKELSERSLFLINPPINSNLFNVRNFFKTISKESLIENFLINNENLDYEINLTKLTTDLYDQDENQDQEDIKLPNGTGLVVFVDKSAANLAFTKLKKYVKNLTKNERSLYQWNFNELEPASIRFINSYKKDMLSIPETSKAVSLALEEFEKREAASLEQLQDLKETVDEDGFTLVVGKNRKTKKGILENIDNVNKFTQESDDKKKERKEKQDFYRFQIRDRKKMEMNELLKKFREDTERIKELKHKKRFRPY
ncbi:Ribosomal RNA-processing protein [Wickerhamomyces ciferrii]|uniref:Ribosomal RNA-processing protein n=1 Tax=Wickerhamomyces ciferrii (strain ATCC 14091 / BCRC 22168 / CBS 111 / JCM 3599 / NBRC 0793 / NRRL Y-1031 F-60-10) TaxID=1206466 RepID=K0KTG3_WICCF|nr:Ribosomal RNA-processing protein [Wickerhamomyces ciferrii]CCH46456.1 Ribosomal RNA-processing protein [Wickerhamomyces ciferrii]